MLLTGQWHVIVSFLSLFIGMPVGKKVMHLLIFCFNTVAVMRKNAFVHTAENMSKDRGIDNLFASYNDH